MGSPGRTFEAAVVRLISVARTGQYGRSGRERGANAGLPGPRGAGPCALAALSDFVTAIGPDVYPAGLRGRSERRLPTCLPTTG